MLVSSSLEALSGLFATEQRKKNEASPRPSSSASRGDTVSISPEARNLAAMMRPEENAGQDMTEPGAEPITEELLEKHKRQAEGSLGERNAEELRKEFSDLIHPKAGEQTPEETIKKLKQKLAELAQKEEKTQADMEKIKALQEQISAMERQLAEEKAGGQGRGSGSFGMNGSTAASASSSSAMGTGAVSGKK